jgi:alpha-tubulin suppressor-like RCC1 family protein
MMDAVGNRGRWRPRTIVGRLAVAGVAAVLAVPAGAAAASAGARGSLAQPSGLNLVSWGDNSDGQLDNGHVGGSVFVPGAAVTNTFGGQPNLLTQVSVGCDHGVALTASGQVLAWGSNQFGQVGMTGQGPIPTPLTVPIPAPVKSVKAGCQFSMALDFDGHVWTWGAGSVGQLGTGKPARSGGIAKVKLPKGTVVTAISAGEAFGVALNRSGQLFAWGIGNLGQLGNGGHITGSATPVRVHLPKGTKVTSVASGGEHSLALTSTGRVLAWGDNGFGQLGDGTKIERDTPVPITMPSSVQKVAHLIGGGVFSLALTAKGRLLSWGGNAFGQLGDGTFTDRVRPVRVHQGSATVTSAAAGGLYALARTSGGGILAWGINEAGQLGNNDTANSSLPITPDMPIGTVVAVGTGSSSNSSFAIMR